jgi:diadenosine tetraphosphate (Ap4A) HIT family hydrolase
MSGFILDERLANDTTFVADLPFCRALLMKDRRFPWIVLVPRRPGAVELFDLDPDERAQLIEETALVARALKKVTGAAKINVGALGNVVSQLHMHVVARREDDDAFPRGVWGSGAAEAYPDGEAEACVALIREELGY